MKSFKIGKITKDERDLFEAIRDPEYTNFALLKVKFENIESSCICAINEDLKDEYSIKPLAILLNDHILNKFKILCPNGKLPNVK